MTHWQIQGPEPRVQEQTTTLVEGAVRYVGKDRVDRTGNALEHCRYRRYPALRAVEAGSRWNAFSKRQADRRAERHAANR